MEKANEFISDAEKTLSGGLYRTSINRSYYAVFNAARALLILAGSNPETHEGIITMLSLHFIKKGILPQSVIKTYKNLLSHRTDADYGDFDSITSDDARELLTHAQEAMQDIESAREKFLAEMQ